MGLFTRKKERKRASALPNSDAHNRARDLATSDPTLDYAILYSVLLSGGTEEDAIEASRTHAAEIGGHSSESIGEMINEASNGGGF